MDYGSEAGHDFIFSNAGRAPLVLTAGPTTCRCTVSEVNDDKLLPGESFKVTVHWKAREVSNDYRQTVQIYTNDPLRPVVKLAIVGEVAVAVAGGPARSWSSASFRRDEPASGEVRLLCSRRRAAGNPRFRAFRPGPGQVLPGRAASRCRRPSCAAEKASTAAYC